MHVHLHDLPKQHMEKYSGNISKLCTKIPVMFLVIREEIHNFKHFNETLLVHCIGHIFK